MPLILEKNINQHIVIGVWQCTESLTELEADLFLPEADRLDISKTSLHKRKIEKLTTRKLTSYLLNKYFNKEFKGLKKLHTGKPVLTDSELEMSVSHCESYLTVLLSTHDKAGIDLQNINPKIKTVAPRIFSSDELSQINNNEQLLARAWSAKEAMFKYYEKGNINFIRDLHLSHINDLKQFKGILTCNNEKIEVKFECIQVSKNYQIVYCHEN